jgi:hypothetical protein
MNVIEIQCDYVFVISTIDALTTKIFNRLFLYFVCLCLFNARITLDAVIFVFRIWNVNLSAIADIGFQIQLQESG